MLRIWRGLVSKVGLRGGDPWLETGGVSRGRLRKGFFDVLRELRLLIFRVVLELEREILKVEEKEWPDKPVSDRHDSRTVCVQRSDTVLAVSSLYIYIPHPKVFTSTSITRQLTHPPERSTNTSPRREKHTNTSSTWCPPAPTRRGRQCPSAGATTSSTWPAGTTPW